MSLCTDLEGGVRECESRIFKSASLLLLVLRIRKLAAQQQQSAYTGVINLLFPPACSARRHLHRLLNRPPATHYCSSAA